MKFPLITRMWLRYVRLYLLSQIRLSSVCLYGDPPRGTTTSGVKRKYSDVGYVEGYISETVQDTAWKQEIIP